MKFVPKPIGGINLYELKNNYNKAKKVENMHQLNYLLDGIKPLLDSLPYYVMLVDEEHNVLVANKAVEGALGVKPEEIAGGYCPRVVHGYEEPYPGCPLEESLGKGKKPVEKEVYDSSSNTWALSSVYPTPFSHQGKTVFWHTVGDITERKRAEEELKDKTRKFNSIFKTVPVGITLLNRDMRFLRVNHFIQEKIGLREEEFLHKHCYEVVGQYANDETKRGREKVCDQCAVVKTLEDGRIHTHERWVNEHLYVRNTSAPVMDEEGSIIGAVETIEDITKRKEAEKKQRLFSQAAEGALDGIHLVDLQGYIIYSNQAVEDIQGFTPQEQYGRHVNDMNVDPTFASRVIMPALEEKGMWAGEVEIRHKEGHPVPVWLNASVIRDEKGEPTALLGVFRDITDLKRYARRLEDSNRMKDLFADILRHDLLNPITIARSYAELLMEEEKGYKKRTMAEKIMKNLGKAKSIMDDARTISRLEDTEKLNMKTLDLLGVIERVVSSYEPLAKEEGVEIENRINGPLKAKTNFIIEEVFSNLVSNALKYAREGKRVVVEGGEGEQKLRIRVVDFGRGIGEGEKEEIFTRFQRKDKRGVEGTGMGLAIAQRIVELHSGKIWVEDSPGGGATFVVELPKL